MKAPSENTLEECKELGATHKAYGWSTRMKTGWNFEQLLAYAKGYFGSPNPDKVEWEIETFQPWRLEAFHAFMKGRNSE